ncbi:MAG: hypothetical protein K2Y32_24145 [Candidatus Obscuribacterales bacterium]|nr:hypothetical protein [Candidatus Obscuribacterales bacterium]
MMRRSFLVVAAVSLPLLLAAFEPLLPNRLSQAAAANKSDKAKLETAALFFKAVKEEDLFIGERLFNKIRQELGSEQDSEIVAAQALLYARCQSLPQCLNLIRDSRLTEKPNLTSEALANLTLAAYLSKDKNLAMQFFQKLKKAAPQKSLTEHLAILTTIPYTVLDNEAEAKNLLKKMSNLSWGDNDGTARILLTRLTASYQTLSSETAYRTIQEILKKKGSDSAILIICAENLRKQARYQEAIKLLDRLLSKRNNHWWGRELRARIYMDLYEAGPAAADCKELLKQAASPSDRKHVLGLMSRIYEHSSDYFNAYKAQSELLLIGAAKTTQTTEPAISRELARSSPKLLLQKGELAVKCLDRLDKKELVQIATNMEALLAYKPNNLPALYVLACTQRKLGLNSQALKNINLGLSSQPDYAPWYEERAKVWQGLGQKDQARRDLEKAKSLR